MEHSQLESINKDSLDKFIRTINDNAYNDENGEYSESLILNSVIKTLAANQDFFKKISREDAIYFIKKIKFISYKESRAVALNAIISTNDNLLPIFNNQDLVKIIKDFDISLREARVNLIKVLSKNEKVDLFKDMPLSQLCQLLTEDLEMVNDRDKVSCIVAVADSNQNLFNNVDYPVAVNFLIEKLKISFESEKYKLINLIDKKNNIFRNVGNLDEACHLITDHFNIQHDNIKFLLLEMIIKSNPSIVREVQTIDDLKDKLQILKVNKNVNTFDSIGNICKLLVRERPEILGNLDNINEIINNFNIFSSENKFLLIKTAINLQEEKSDRYNLILDMFQNLSFLIIYPNFVTEIFRECLVDFNVDEKSVLMNKIIERQMPLNRANVISSFILNNAIDSKDFFLKLDISKISNQDSLRIINQARLSFGLSNFDLLKFSKLVNCDKYSSVINLLEKSGQDNIYKSSKAREIEEIFNPNRDNNFDINKCKAINLINYSQLVDEDKKLYKFFTSEFLQEVDKNFVPYTKNCPISLKDLGQINRTLNIKNIRDKFIDLAKIVDIFSNIKEKVDNITVVDIEGLDIDDQLKVTLKKTFNVPSNITQDEVSIFFKSILQLDANFQFSIENLTKLDYFLRNNNKDMCALIRHPQGIVNLGNSLYSVADGCVANIGNQMSMMVLKSLIENEGGENSQSMARIYHALLQSAIIPLINSDSDFMGGESNIMANQNMMSYYYIAPSNFLQSVARQFNSFTEVHDLFTKDMGAERATEVMIECKACDRELGSFDEWKAKLMGACKTISKIMKENTTKRMIANSNDEIKDLQSELEKAEKLTLVDSMPPSRFRPMTGLRSASNLLQRFVNR